MGLLVMTLMCLTGLVLLSPIPLTWLAGQEVDWNSLASVGAAYSAAANVFSSLAFCGIVLSLFLQWRQNRMILLFSYKQQHMELAKLALDNPQFLYVDGVSADPDAALKVYANLLVSHWAIAWDLGIANDDSTRVNARRLFKQEVARDWWDTWKFSYLSSKRRRRFFQIVDQEWRNAMAPDRTDSDQGPDTAEETFTGEA
ncbi:MAG TPA: DUF6082 family protein [Micromonosporaceae bacterium]|nr:DUF6082 family protein [Micromonosporaceae bacterium]